MVYWEDYLEVTIHMITQRVTPGWKVFNSAVDARNITLAVKEGTEGAPGVVVMSIIGTSNILDAINDVRMVPLQSGLCRDALVHKGFHSSMMDMANVRSIGGKTDWNETDTVGPWVTGWKEWIRVSLGLASDPPWYVISGHSLGAAISQMMSYAFETTERVVNIGWATPSPWLSAIRATGDWHRMTTRARIKGKKTRNVEDAVANLPPSGVAAFIGSEFIISSRILNETVSSQKLWSKRFLQLHIAETYFSAGGWDKNYVPGVRLLRYSGPDTPVF
jgi:hypothetical protein